MRKYIPFILLFFTASTLLAREPDNSILLESASMKNWSVRAFTLEKDMVLNIVATGQTVQEHWLAKAWIIESETRQPVWQMDLFNSQKISNEGRRRYMGDLEFKAGTYEIYYGVDQSVKYKSKGLSKIIDDLFDNLDYYDRDTRYWSIHVTPMIEDESSFLPVNITDINVAEKPAINLVHVGDNGVRESFFNLDAEQTLRIVMLGEGMKKNNRMYDYGWITNKNTRERVWQADIRMSQHAGGADKNRLINTEITLPAGEYTLHYITDDSHSPDQFNQMPPFDPMHWGIQLFSVDDITIIDEKETQNASAGMGPIVKLDRAGNNLFYCEGFEIKSPLQISIKAQGEFSRMFNGFVDHGWIINARTRKKVWSMTLENTNHAGGSQKNKKADEIITLEPGAYKIYFVTDDSHSHDSWNSSPPTEPELWGISLTPVGDNTHNVDILPYSEENDPAILASLKQMGNSEHRRTSFSLDKRSMVRIYALGEGDADGMYDYGWIENKNGDLVWEMKFKETMHAGGARKNRLLNKIIELDAGDYVLHFQTDDSHSFNNWNAPRPDDFPYWGITLIMK